MMPATVSNVADMLRVLPSVVDDGGRHPSAGDRLRLPQVATEDD
jgi:hypothetical protein